MPRIRYKNFDNRELVRTIPDSKMFLYPLMFKEGPEGLERRLFFKRFYIDITIKLKKQINFINLIPHKKSPIGTQIKGPYFPRRYCLVIKNKNNIEKVIDRKIKRAYRKAVQSIYF